MFSGRFCRLTIPTYLFFQAKTPPNGLNMNLKTINMIVVKDPGKKEPTFIRPGSLFFHPKIHP